MEYLDGHQAAVLEVSCQVDRSHATTAELALKRVAVGEGSLQVAGEIGQVIPKKMGRLRWDTEKGRASRGGRVGRREENGGSLAWDWLCRFIKDSRKLGESGLSFLH